MRLMSTKANKAKALQFMADLERKGLGATRDAAGPKFVWCLPGISEVQDHIGAIEQVMAKHLKTPLTIKVHGVTAEEDRVAVEAESYAELIDGGVYNNRYHFLLEFEDGEIVRLKEYGDTHHVNDVWGKRLRRAG
jgi:ketosteroid isomerase-like protein